MWNNEALDKEQAFTFIGGVFNDYFGQFNRIDVYAWPENGTD